MSRLPVEQLSARLQPLNLAGTEVHHLPDWQGYDDPKRLAVIRQIAEMRGRDPRIANLAASIIKKSGAKPREYKKQAAALLKWVQNPKNIYYLNEPGERLQDPIFTIKHGFGDCDDQIIVLGSFFTSIRLDWKLVIAGTCNGKKVRYVEGQRYPKNCKWAHIYCMVGVPPFHPKEWYFCETTINGVPLGWDVISGDKGYLPELEKPKRGPARVMRAPRARWGFRPSRLPAPEHRSSAYSAAYGATLIPVGAAVGAGIGAHTAQSGSPGNGNRPLIDWKQILSGVLTGVAISVTTAIIMDLRDKRLKAKGEK